MRSINLQMDGNRVVATWDNFNCLATSPAGFGDTIWQAFGRLIDNTPAIEINAIVTSIENAPQNTKELAATTTNSRYATAREVYDEYIGMYGDADDSPIFNDWLIERLHAEERHDA